MTAAVAELVCRARVAVPRRRPAQTFGCRCPQCALGGQTRQPEEGELVTVVVPAAVVDEMVVDTFGPLP